MTESQQDRLAWKIERARQRALAERQTVARPPLTADQANAEMSRPVRQVTKDAPATATDDKPPTKPRVA